MSEAAFDPVDNAMHAELEKELATLTTSLAISNHVALAARAFLGIGYQPVLIAPRDKKPVGLEWQKIVYSADQDLESIFTPDHNIGLRLDASKLVDADLDSPWARALADAFLPKSTMVWGRKSEPASHRAYRVKSASAVKYRKYTGLFKDAGDREVVLLERRAGAGKQTVVPPSTHKDTGEKIEWVVPGPATQVDPKVLAHAFDELAAAALIASVWRPSLRHKLALAVPAFLLKAGYPADSVRKLLEPVIERFDEASEAGDRMRAMQDTISKHEHDPRSVSGAKELRELLPEHAAGLMARLADWLQLRPGAGSDMPVIIVGDRQPSATVREAYAALLARNREQLTMFQQTGRLVRVRIDEDDRPRIEQIAEPMLRSILIDSAQWFVITRQGPQPAPPPEYVATSIIAKPNWPEMPPIRGIVEAPVFAADGTLSTEPGYQPNTRLWFQPQPGFVTPPVSDSPSLADVAAARALLLNDLLVDFPFHDEASRAHMVALLLLPFVRELINGPTPQHLVDAPTPGTGKGLLSDIAALIATGREAGKTPAPKTDEEWRKRITSQLMHGSSLILTDNLAEKLDSASLAAALTTPEWEDRKLGVNKLVQVPNRATWVATGNNVTLSNELARRTAWIRLTPNVEEPWKRTEFKHPNLKPWVREHRGRLVHALLTLARAWLVAGRPRPGGVRLGSFEDWCDVGGGIVTAAGIPGFLANHAELYEAADTEMAPWRALIEIWAAQLRSGFVRVDELLTLVNQHSLLAEELGDERLTDRARRTKLGILLRKYRDRVIAGHRIQAAPDNGRREYSMYRLEKASSTPTGWTS